jgi:hypothetical protein
LWYPPSEAFFSLDKTSAFGISSTLGFPSQRFLEYGYRSRLSVRQRLEETRVHDLNHREHGGLGARGLAKLVSCYGKIRKCPARIALKPSQELLPIKLLELCTVIEVSLSHEDIFGPVGAAPRSKSTIQQR